MTVVWWDKNVSQNFSSTERFITIPIPLSYTPISFEIIKFSQNTWNAWNILLTFLLGGFFFTFLDRSNQQFYNITTLIYFLFHYSNKQQNYDILVAIWSWTSGLSWLQKNFICNSHWSFSLCVFCHYLSLN